MDKGLSYDANNRIYMADTNGMRSLIHQHNDKALIVLVSSSSGCSGTPSVIQYLNSIVPEQPNVQFIFILGDPLSSCKAFPELFSKLNHQIISVIPSESYKAGNFFREDARKRSDDLLKAVFPASRSDIIGTPKFCIMQPQTEYLIFHGFRGYKNPYPEDIVRYFLKNPNH